MVKPFGRLVPVGSHVAVLTPPAYHQVVFLGPYSSRLMETSSWGGLRA